MQKNKPCLILVTGGARSGKSEFAERYVEKYATKAGYIATAEVLDDEMGRRVELHRQRRSSSFWTTYEYPRNAEQVFAQLPVDIDMVLFDCLTVYVANMMYSSFEKADSKDDPADVFKLVKENIRKLLEAASSSGRTVVFVTNEVGCGIVPDNYLAREYRDMIGLVNAMVAKACDKLFLTVCGHAVDIKKISEQLVIGGKE